MINYAIIWLPLNAFSLNLFFGIITLMTDYHYYYVSEARKSDK